MVRNNVVLRVGPAPHARAAKVQAAGARARLADVYREARDARQATGARTPAPDEARALARLRAFAG